MVIVATIKAIKYHGGVEKDKIQEENILGIEKGINNLYTHIYNIKKEFGLNVIVALNKYNTDTQNEIEFLQKKLEQKNIQLSIVEGWAQGGEGAIDIAKKIVNITKQQQEFKYIYDIEDKIQTKIEKVARKIYRAKEVIFSKEALENIEKIEKLGYKNLQICIAKTQYSLSDDPKNLECIEEYNINIKNVDLKAGAGFVVVFAGNIMTMPGLPKQPAAENIDIDKDGNVKGIF